MSTVFFNLRIDEALNDRIAEIAREEGRSKNKQIEYILRQYVKGYEQESGTITVNQTNNRSATVKFKKN